MIITNTLNMPAPFVDAVNNEYKYKDKQYSVTALLKGATQNILERRHADEIEQDVSEMVWMIFGSAVHKILEDSQETITQLKENKLIIDLPNGYKISGIFDLYDDKTKTVTDYKTASVNKVLFNDWDDYRKQTLMYCWMLRKIGFEAENGEIVAMLKDHSKAKAMQGGDYPKHPVYRIKWKFTDKDFEEIETFIMNRIEDISDLENMADEDLPACTPSERWHKDDTFAIMKDGRKSAVRVFKSKEEAVNYFNENNLDKKHIWSTL